jgi:competence protein ComEC
MEAGLRQRPSSSLRWHPNAVVSVGRGNTFGHPRFEVIQRVADNGTKLYRIDEFGLTTFLLDREGGIKALAGGN